MRSTQNKLLRIIMQQPGTDLTVGGEGGNKLALPSGPAETARNRLAGVGGEGPEVLTEGGGERISQVHPCHLGPQTHLPAFDRDIQPHSTEN